MKICHVINDLSRGGAESHLYTLVKLQIEKGNHVSLLLLGKDQSEFISLEELSGPFSSNICEHLRNYEKQITRKSDGIFLENCKKFNL